VLTDPEVPPLPPHVRFEQVKGLSKALLAGDPAAGRILAGAAKGKFAEVTTR
jgi:pyruvate dehydrogenase (quinone)